MIALHFLRGFDMKKEQAARSAAFFQSNSAENEVRNQCGRLSMLVGWLGRREETIGTSRPLSASPSSSALQHLSPKLKALILEEWFLNHCKIVLGS